MDSGLSLFDKLKKNAASTKCRFRSTREAPCAALISNLWLTPLTSLTSVCVACQMYPLISIQFLLPLVACQLQGDANYEGIHSTQRALLHGCNPFLIGDVILEEEY